MYVLTIINVCCPAWPCVGAPAVAQLLHPIPATIYTNTQKAFMHIDNYECKLFLHGLAWGLRLLLSFHIPFLQPHIQTHMHSDNYKYMQSLHGLMSTLVRISFTAFCIHVLEPYTQKAFICSCQASFLQLYDIIYTY